MSAAVPVLRGAAKVIWSVLQPVVAALPAPGRVVDVGGGSGVLAVALAFAGCDVTVIDASPDALAVLRSRAAQHGVSDRVHSEQGDVAALGDLVEEASAELVLCHNVLEFVDDPIAAVSSMRVALRPAGALSLLVATRAAAVLARATSGQLDQALRALSDPAGRISDTDVVLRRYDVAGIAELLAHAGLAVGTVHGVEVFADLIPAGSARDGRAAETVRALESTAAALSPYRDIAGQLHVLAHAPASASSADCR